MATTDAKPGFRLPWSADRSETADPSAPSAAAAGDPPAVDAPAPDAPPDHAPTDQETETPAMIDAAPAATDQEAAVETTTATAPDATAAPSSSGTPASGSGRRPNKFMADLTKAMQAAAESTREETLVRLGNDAKAYIESIHATSATEATELRKLADDDVAAIREWSKTEIARIREETDERIAHRKNTLEHEIEEHAAEIEARIERVQARVSAFEAEMAAFFERLLAEEDPTRFAAMAESLPEPPPLDHAAAGSWVPPTVEAAPEPVADAPTPEPVADAADATETHGDSAEGQVDQSAEPTSSDDSASPSGTTDGGDLFGLVEPPAADDAASDDPRLAMLGASPDFAAAEAEAASFVAPNDGSEEALPPIADEAIAARIAGLVPTGDEAATGTTSTRVVVTGLVSVASIAGFKRHLARADGVQSVGVSSGPDGEFVFAVGHGAEVALRDVIPTLQGFNAQVTAEAEGELTVSARDPETEG